MLTYGGRGVHIYTLIILSHNDTKQRGDARVFGNRRLCLYDLYLINYTLAGFVIETLRLLLRQAEHSRYFSEKGE